MSVCCPLVLSLVPCRSFCLLSFRSLLIPIFPPVPPEFIVVYVVLFRFLPVFLHSVRTSFVYLFLSYIHSQSLLVCPLLMRCVLGGAFPVCSSGCVWRVCLLVCFLRVSVCVYCQFFPCCSLVRVSRSLVCPSTVALFFLDLQEILNMYSIYLIFYLLF